MEDKILELIQDQEEISWQSIIYDLVRSEGMDPWDIDVSQLARRYLDIVKQLKETDFRISGKMVLAAAILLKIKSNRLLSEDLAHLDNMIAGEDEDETEAIQDREPRIKNDGTQLVPRTPQPRKRKVSVYELVEALQKALEVKRRKRREIPSAPEVLIPESVFDLTKIMGDIFGTIEKFFGEKAGERLLFEHLIPEDSKQAKIHTFIPLLHLVNRRKIDLLQEKHFGEIEIAIAQARIDVEEKVNKEIKT